MAERHAHRYQGGVAIRVFLVDDSSEFLASAVRLIASRPDVEIVGWAESAWAALERTAHESTDLVLIDVAMPGLNGLDTTRLLKQRPWPPYVAILTLHDNPQYRAAAAAAGADAFIPKSDLWAHLPALLDRVALARLEHPRTAS